PPEIAPFIAALRPAEAERSGKDAISKEEDKSTIVEQQEVKKHKNGDDFGDRDRTLPRGGAASRTRGESKGLPELRVALERAKGRLDEGDNEKLRLLNVESRPASRP